MLLEEELDAVRIAKTVATWVTSFHSVLNASIWNFSRHGWHVDSPVLMADLPVTNSTLRPMPRWVSG